MDRLPLPTEEASQAFELLTSQTPLLHRSADVGWLFTFWAAPTMTAAHLVFSIATTPYILIAVQFEERDLVTVHGSAYDDYRKRVPMIVPGLRPSTTGDLRVRTAWAR